MAPASISAAVNINAFLLPRLVALPQISSLFDVRIIEFFTFRLVVATSGIEIFNHQPRTRDNGEIDSRFESQGRVFSDGARTNWEAGLPPRLP